MNNDLLQMINDRIKQLQEMISFISDLDDQGNEKVISIKNKTVDVLDSVLKRINDTDNNNVNEDELHKFLAAIEVRSNELYESALNKIKELINIDYLNNTNEIETSIVENNDLEDEFSKNVIEVLKGWLIPEGDEK